VVGHIGAGYHFLFSRYANFSFFMLLKPLHPFHEIESTIGIIKKVGLFFCMVAGHMELHLMYLKFARYEKFSCFMVLKPLHPFTELESKCDHSKNPVLKSGHFY